MKRGIQRLGQQLNVGNAIKNNSSVRWMRSIVQPNAVTMCGGRNEEILRRVWQKRENRLKKTTGVSIERLNGVDVAVKNVEFWIKNAGSFDETQDQTKQSDVHIALRGIAHTVVLLQLEDKAWYLLDRVVEGIRLSPLETNNSTHFGKCTKFDPKEYKKIKSYNNVRDLSSKNVVDFVQEHSKTKYHSITNSCVQLSWYFYQQFLFQSRILSILKQ